MPWSPRGQDRTGQRTSRRSCWHVCMPYIENECTICTKSADTQIWTHSTRLHRGKLSTWSSLAVLYIALLNLLVPACMQSVTLSQTQEKRVEPLHWPPARAHMMHLLPQSEELSVKALSWQSHWLQLQMSVRSQRTISIGKPPVCMKWTDLPTLAMTGNRGQPDLAPCRHQASHVQHQHTQLASEVTRKHEGRRQDMDRDLQPGPQHESGTSARNVHGCSLARFESNKPRLATNKNPFLPRHRVPVTAPISRNSCKSALPTVAHFSAQQHKRYGQFLPGTRTPATGNSVPTEQTRTDARACIVLESQLSPADPAFLMLRGTSARHVDSPKRQPVLLSSAGLTRNEPLVFHLKDTATMPYLQPIRIFSKSVRAKPSWTEPIHRHNQCLKPPVASHGRSWR